MMGMLTVLVFSVRMLAWIATDDLPRADDISVIFTSAQGTILVNDRDRDDSVVVTHTFSTSFDLTAVNGAVYCYAPRAISVVAIDESGDSIARPSSPLSVASIRFDWISTSDRAADLNMRSRGSVGSSNQLERMPPRLQSYQIRLPVWKAVRTERVEVTITENEEWQPLPNGSRLLFFTEADRGDYRQIAVGHEVELREDGSIVPPPFHIMEIRDADGAKIGPLSYGSRIYNRLPENLENDNRKRIAVMLQRYNETKTEPRTLAVTVIHEYEPQELIYSLTDLVLGDARRTDRIDPVD